MILGIDDHGLSLDWIYYAVAHEVSNFQAFKLLAPISILLNQEISLNRTYWIQIWFRGPRCCVYCPDDLLGLLDEMRPWSVQKSKNWIIGKTKFCEVAICFLMSTYYIPIYFWRVKRYGWFSKNVPHSNCKSKDCLTLNVQGLDCSVRAMQCAWHDRKY